MTRRYVGSASGYKGVIYQHYFKKPLQKPWKAYLQQGKKTLLLGYFATKEEAAEAHDQAALRLFGPGTYLNRDHGCKPREELPQFSPSPSFMHSQILFRNSFEHIAELAKIDHKYNDLVSEAKKRFTATHPDADLETNPKWLNILAEIEAERMEEFKVLKEMVFDPPRA